MTNVWLNYSPEVQPADCGEQILHVDDLRFGMCLQNIVDGAMQSQSEIQLDLFFMRIFPGDVIAAVDEHHDRPLEQSQLLPQQILAQLQVPVVEKLHHRHRQRLLLERDLQHFVGKLFVPLGGHPSPVEVDHAGVVARLFGHLVAFVVVLGMFRPRRCNCLVLMLTK